MAKELKWKGLTEEQAKALDLPAFLALVPSRERRSITRAMKTEDWQALNSAIESGKSNVKTHVREFVILPSMLGKTIAVYTGKEFVRVICTLEMLGHRRGEFALTRRGVSHSGAGVGSTRSSKAATAR